jgi:DNA-binding beta-propeller fold protein YncE
VDNAGGVYVVDLDDTRIQKFTSDGTFITQWSSAGPGEGQFNQPGGVAADRSGDIYLTDWNNHHIQKYDPNGTFITQLGNPG